MVICLERGADLHLAQLMPLPLTVSCFSEIQIGLPFWYRLTQAVPEKGPLNVCVGVPLTLTIYCRFKISVTILLLHYTSLTASFPVSASVPEK